MGNGTPKSPLAIEAMRHAGKLAASVLRQTIACVQPGITTLELDRHAGEIIRSHGAVSAFLGYRDFPRHCCVSVNEAVVHGIGDGRCLRFGDLVKIDIGIRYNGYVGDVAMSVAVGGCSPSAQKLMDVTVNALHDGIAAARPGKRVSDISRAIQRRVENAGFNVVREFVGHGVGRLVHEDPQIPNYVDDNSNGKLRPGMTIAIEPMVNAGTAAVEVLGDQWTVVTKDRQLSAHFEHTVLITDGEAEVLTKDGLPPLY